MQNNLCSCVLVIGLSSPRIDRSLTVLIYHLAQTRGIGTLLCISLKSMTASFSGQSFFFKFIHYLCLAWLLEAW